MPKTILILGGYGNAGRRIAEYLLRERDDIRVIVAGRDLSRAQDFVGSLNENYAKNSNRASALQMDASSVASLDAGFCQCDMVVVASSTPEYARQIAEAAIRAKIGYFAIVAQKPYNLISFKEQVEQAQCVFVTDGGCYPGLPGTLVRYASTLFKNGLKRAEVFILFQTDWKTITLAESTVREFLFIWEKIESKVFSHGEWKESAAFREFDFGPPFDSRDCMPSYQEDFESLPGDLPGGPPEELACYMAGMNWVTDTVVFPLSVLAFRWFGKRALGVASRMFWWSMRTFSKPPYGQAFVLDATTAKAKDEDGDGDGDHHFRLSVSHQDIYEITIIPAVATLLQVLDKRPKPGMYYQAQLVDPRRFFQDLKRLGLRVEEVHKKNDQSAI